MSGRISALWGVAYNGGRAVAGAAVGWAMGAMPLRLALAVLAAAPAAVLVVAVVADRSGEP